MSVFTFDTSPDNPVTTAELDRVCRDLGVTIADDEKEDYRRLLAVFHEAAEDLLKLPPFEILPDLERFPRRDVHVPPPADNPLGGWSHRCTITDTRPPLPGAEPGLLAGRTVVFKANVAVAGVPTTVGSAVFAHHIPRVDATIVTRVLEAGATVAGLAACENMCHSGTSHSACTGVVHNPYARGYSSGGSSSGCGALVGSGAVDMAMGADQGGSIRIPSSWCGLCGLKPTFGLVPYTGLGSNEPTNDHTGPMTRGVLDNARLLSVVAGADGMDDRAGAGAPLAGNVPNYASLLLAAPAPTRLDGVHIGILAEALTRPAMDPRVRETFDAAMDRFRALGAVVETVSIPMHVQGPAIWTAISKIGGAYAKLGPAFSRRGFVVDAFDAPFRAPIAQETWDLLYPSTKNTFLNGHYGHRVFPGLAGHATNLCLQLRRAYDDALSHYTLLATPTVPYIANAHARVPFADIGHVAEPPKPIDYLAPQKGLSSNTCPFDQTGHPALTIPCGRLPIVEGPLADSGTKLPVGLQLIGRWYGESDIYRAAYAWELTNKWEEM